MRWRHLKNRTACSDCSRRRRGAEDAEESQIEGKKTGAAPLERRNEKALENQEHAEITEVAENRNYLSMSFRMFPYSRVFRVLPVVLKGRRPIYLAPTICLIAACLILISVYRPTLRATAQSGALIPVSVKNEPDSSILSLQALKVDVVIDNQHARVKVLQIFDSRTDQVLEG